MLRGERIFIRPLEESDLPLLVAWRNAPENWAGFFNRYPLTMSQQKGFYAALLGDASRKLFAICTDGGPVGTIGLDQIDHANQSAEIGNVLIGPADCAGKGFAQEAIRLLAGFAFGHLNLHRLHLNVFADNPRAIHVYERCGFKREGLLREARFARGRFQDVAVMALLRSEFGP